MSFQVRRPFQRLSTSRGRKWREGLALFILLVVSVALQGALSSGLGWSSFRPDLVLVVVVFWRLKKGLGGSLIVGLGGGLLGDVFSAGMLGLGAVSLAVVVGVVVLTCRAFYREHFSTKIVMVGGSCLISSFVYFLLLGIFRSPPSWGWAWKEMVWPHLWQTTLVAPFWLWVSQKVVIE